MYYDIVLSISVKRTGHPGARVIDPAHPIENRYPIRSGWDPHARIARTHPSDPTPEIREARRRIASTIVRTPDHLELGPTSPTSPEARTATDPAPQLRSAANAVAMLSSRSQARRLDHRRGQQARASRMRRDAACPAVVVIGRAGVEDQADEGARRLVSVPYEIPGALWRPRVRVSTGRSCIRSTIDFIAGHSTMGLGFSRTPDAAAVIAGIGGGGLMPAWAARQR
jgi:hypothetical protein